MEMSAAIATVGSLLGDPVRAAMLTALMNGRSLPAGELAFIGNVSPQTASFHLGKLLEAALISMERQGKHRYYRLANEQVALALECMASISPVKADVVARSLTRYPPGCTAEVHFARTCYRHLAGHLAVEIHRSLVHRELIVKDSEKRFELTGGGERWMASLGSSATIATGRRSYTGRACLDWTVRRHHLGGPLGVLLLTRLQDAGWLVAKSDTRALRLTQRGRQELERQLGLNISPF